MLRKSLSPSVLALAAAIMAFSLPAEAANPPAPTMIDASAPRTLDGRPWPRQYTVNGVEFSLYRPELDSWTGNKLTARAVMAVKTGTTTDANGQNVNQNNFGVVWLSARTETDRDANTVTLDNITFERANFPADRAKDADYLKLAQGMATGTAVVANLRQIEAGLAANDAAKTMTAVTVSNTPPDIIFSFVPAVLVPVDGQPVWKPAGVTGVETVINTRSLLLRYKGRVYLGYGGHWASAASLDGSWSGAATVAAPLTQAMQAAVAANRAPAEKDVPADIASAFQSGQFPAVYVRSRPTELIPLSGQPEFSAIPGTQLSYVNNTAADVFVDAAANNSWYVLISGRWFTAASNNGPWIYVPPNALPPDFAKIPASSPKSAVLASVAGTSEAEEAVIANSIPQTATVDKTKVSFTAQYDGAPQFKPIQGTNLSYAVNSATPIINVPGHSYYALSDGVWFVSEASPDGPWAVTSSVPPAIYTIPSSSPVHYVTYARVYGGDGNNVYVGYTPGYYGTVVSNGVVVYGTGYPCDPWIGATWYGCPATYGYGAAFAYGTAVGWSLAFGWGYYDPWYDPWWGPWGGYWPGYYYPWAWGGAVAANVYGRWGNSVVAGTAAAWANPWTGNYGRAGAGGFYNTATGGRGYGYAGRNTNIYTGNSAAAAGGIRYNPETGRAVAGRGGAVGNIYTGNGAVAGGRTVVNTDTGQVTRQVGGAARTDTGAVAGGAFNSAGAAGSAKGAGYIRYDNATGEVNHGGVANINGDVYAGRDGNVYRYNQSGGWEKAGANNRFTSTQANASLNRERATQNRGNYNSSSKNASGSRASSYSGYRGGGFRGGGGGFRGGGRR
jgi:hypothetical protein